MIDLFNLAIARKMGGGGSSKPVLQDKSLNITDNGSQTITPDAGYDGLSRVDVSVNVSGGGSSAPTVGFVPSEWDVDGYITNGTWYGKNIPAGAFCNSSVNVRGWRLTNITLPDNLDLIDNSAFNCCTDLSLTTLPDTVRYIGPSAFYQCASLQLEKLPNSLKELGGNAFSGCTSLALTSIDNISQLMTVLNQSVFSGCTSLQISVIPAQIETIQAWAFQNCTGLTQITFKGTPTSIHMNAFKGCSNLTVINVPWAEGEVANAPWGATNATINYNVTA